MAAKLISEFIGSYHRSSRDKKCSRRYDISRSVERLIFPSSVHWTSRDYVNLLLGLEIVNILHYFQCQDTKKWGP